MAIVSHRPIQDASHVDFKLHHHRRDADFETLTLIDKHTQRAYRSGT